MIGSFSFKNFYSVENNILSYYKQYDNEDSRDVISNLDIGNIYLDLISSFKESIVINDPTRIIESLVHFNKFIDSYHFVYEFPCEFLLGLMGLLSYQNYQIRQLSSNLIVQLVVRNNSIGFFFFDSNIIELINEEIIRQNNLIIFYFPIIRKLSSLNSTICQSIFNTISLSVFESCFKIKELNLEASLFLNSISCFQQTEVIQSFILNSIRRMYESSSKDYFKYLACTLHQLSNSTYFNFSAYQFLRLDEFVDFSLKESKYHCVLPICLFLSKLLENHCISTVSKRNVKLILNYSIDFDRPNRSEACIDLLINILKYGDCVTCSYLLKVYPIGKKFIEILQTEDLNFIFKYKIASFLLLFASKVSFEDFSQLIAFNFFEIIEMVFILSDDDLIQKAMKLVVDSFQFFAAAKTLPFFINSLKKSIDFDLIELNQVPENEILNSSLSLLHKIIDGDS